MFIDENSNLDHLLINFLQDVKIKHRFPSDETSEEDREIIKEGANKKKVKPYIHLSLMCLWISAVLLG